ncbi:hypothetical protein AAG570_002585 [Ranatra chinensis]|uniref:Uncharacterized protein n=1 Tax=Ranatra chinensis TaxID=642074 RepID=A0ABD0YK81_9HEMI
MPPTYGEAVPRARIFPWRRPDVSRLDMWKAGGIIRPKPLIENKGVYTPFPGYLLLEVVDEFRRADRGGCAKSSAARCVLNGGQICGRQVDAFKSRTILTLADVLSDGVRRKMSLQKVEETSQRPRKPSTPSAVDSTTSTDMNYDPNRTSEQKPVRTNELRANDEILRNSFTAPENRGHDFLCGLHDFFLPGEFPLDGCLLMLSGTPSVSGSNDDGLDESVRPRRFETERAPRSRVF